MIKNVFVYFSFFIVCAVAMAGCKDNENKKVPELVKFMVISDIHYFDPSLFKMPITADFQTYLASDRKLIQESSAILQNVLASVLAEKPDFLLVPGDLTKDGEKVDHQAVANLFKTLTDKGIKVLVIPGNHDVNNPDAYNYLQVPKAAVANVQAADFATIYSSCGYGNAGERDPASLSYVSEPVNGVWVLGIDACHYLPTSETAGSISTATLAWVKTIVAKAKQQNKVLISMMHHGMIEHFAGQSSLFSEYVISDWQNVSSTLADLGLNVVFTGHYHAQDIAKKTSTSGFIFDIETGSTVTSPCPYRIVTLNTVNKTLAIASKKIDGVAYSTIPAGKTFQQYAKDYLSSGMRGIAGYMLNAQFGVPISVISTYKLDSIMSNAFIAHYTGDELPSASDNINIQTVKAVNATLGGAVQSVWTDPAPADNNITINLTTGVATAN